MEGIHREKEGIRMEIFKNFYKNMEDTALLIGKKAKDTLDTTKLDVALVKAKKQLHRLYARLGKISYDIKMGTIKSSDEIDDIYWQITELLKHVQTLESQITEMKCGSVGCECTKQEEEKRVKEKNIPKPEAGEGGLLFLKFCPNCQIGNHPDAEACISCGHEFES